MSKHYHHEIRRVFADVGPVSTRTLARKCIDADVFDAAWLESATVRAVQRECRKALRETDGIGLPFAGKTTETDDDGSPVWAQRELWDRETYYLNIEQHIDQRDRNHDRAVLLHNECLRKYGEAPDISGLAGVVSQKGQAA